LKGLDHRSNDFLDFGMSIRNTTAITTLQHTSTKWLWHYRRISTEILNKLLLQQNISFVFNVLQPAGTSMPLLFFE